MVKTMAWRQALIWGSDFTLLKHNAQLGLNQLSAIHRNTVVTSKCVAISFIFPLVAIISMKDDNKMCYSYDIPVDDRDGDW